eukprot:COSAG02_NODE_1366_length_13032_cov_721.428207_11_plen_116_part_00
MEKFFQFVWRPRPPTPLADNQLKDIRKNLREIGKKLDAELIKRRTAMDDKEKERRQKMRAEWEHYTSRWQKMYANEKQVRTSKQRYDSDDEYAGVDVVESIETVERVISVEEFPA